MSDPFDDDWSAYQEGMEPPDLYELQQAEADERQAREAEWREQFA